MQILETGSGSTPPDAESKDRQAARLQLTNELNQLLRRFRSYSNEAEWVAALNEGISRFAGESAIFAVQDRSLRLRAQNGLNCPGNLDIPVQSAAAFATAIESKDPIVALCTATEVGEALSGDARGDRAHIFPIANGARVVAVIFAGGKDRVDINGLELLASVASLALQRQANQSLHAQIAQANLPETKPLAHAHGSVTISGPTNSEPRPSFGGRKRALASWAHLSGEERSLHSRAQRFARVKVAEMELAKPEAGRAGRKEGNFYLFLKREIDAARDSYRKQFMTTLAMVDYLHLELVDTAAGGDEQKLGADYPGQLD